MDNVVRNVEFWVKFAFLIAVIPIQAYHFLDMPWYPSNPLLNEALGEFFPTPDPSFLRKLMNRNRTSPCCPPFHPAPGWLNHIEVW
jgi:hypothetical protein